jgi:ABC-type branched-subunit amino acid transport system substrate-binding protein
MIKTYSRLYPLLELALTIFISIFGSLSSSFAQERLRFGISAPLLGVLAEYGQAVQNGVALAGKDHPKDFESLDIIWEDSQWDPKTAVAAFNNLKDNKRCQLIYNWGNPTSEAVAPLAERAKFPLLVMSSDPAVGLGKNYVIRSLRSGAELGSLLADHILKQGHKKVAVLLAENSYVQGLYNGMTQKLSNTPTKVELISQVPLAEQDFKSAITRIKAGKFDAIAVFLITGQVSSFFQQASAQGLNLPAYGADFFGSKTEVLAAGAGIEGAVFPDLAVTEEFRQKYIAAFGNDIQIAFAANAYDLSTQVAKTFSKVELSTLNAHEIIAYLKSSATLNAAHGTFKFENSPEYGPAFVSDIRLRKVVKGEIVTLR